MRLIGLVIIGLAFIATASRAYARTFTASEAWYACNSGDLTSLNELIAQGDLEAFKVGFSRALAAKRCIEILPGEVIFLLDNVGKLVRVRRKGNPDAYWAIAGSWMGDAEPKAPRSAKAKHRTVMCTTSNAAAEASATAQRLPDGCIWLFAGEDVTIERRECSRGVIAISRPGHGFLWVKASTIELNAGGAVC